MNTHDLSEIWYGDYKLEDISDEDTGGLTWWGEQIEVQSISSDIQKVDLKERMGIILILLILPTMKKAIIFIKMQEILLEMNI